MASLLVLNGASFIFMIPSGFKLLLKKKWVKKLKVPKALLLKKTGCRYLVPHFAESLFPCAEIQSYHGLGWKRP